MNIMKKASSLFIICISAPLYASDSLESLKRWRTSLPIIKRMCQKRFLEETAYGFDNTYRKRKGNQYLAEMIADKKKEIAAAQNNNATGQAKLEPLQQNNKKSHAHFVVPPQRAHPSCTHLRTPRNAKEIENLLIIQSILPQSAPSTRRITQFDTQPAGSYFYRQ